MWEPRTTYNGRQSQVFVTKIVVMLDVGIVSDTGGIYLTRCFPSQNVAPWGRMKGIGILIFHYLIILILQIEMKIKTLTFSCHANLFLHNRLDNDN